MRLPSRMRANADADTDAAEVTFFAISGMYRIRRRPFHAYGLEFTNARGGAMLVIQNPQRWARRIVGIRGHSADDVLVKLAKLHAFVDLRLDRLGSFHHGLGGYLGLLPEDPT